MTKYYFVFRITNYMNCNGDIKSWNYFNAINYFKCSLAISVKFYIHNGRLESKRVGIST